MPAMKRVRIDFARPSLGRTLLRGPRPALALLAASLALAPSLASQLSQYRRLLREQEVVLANAQAVAARAQAAARITAPMRPPVPPAQADAVNAAVLQLNLPWRALHDALQSATPANVALLALEPDAKRRGLRITAEAKTSGDMVDYVERLRRQGGFVDAVLVRHEINEQDPNRPIRFQVDAGWNASP
jgi:Tfp pilus assembly protein PilN